MATAKKVGYAKYRLSPLKKITDEAKKIRKAKPSMPWLEAVKQASKKYNGSSKAKPAVKAAPKKKAVKVAKKSRKISGKVTISGGAGNLYRMRDQLEKDIQFYLDAIVRVQKNIPEMSMPEKKRAREIIKSFKMKVVRLKKNLREENQFISKALK